MKVLIIKSNKFSWYKDLVGTLIEVEDMIIESSPGVFSYILINKKISYGVIEEKNCLTIKQQRVDKLKTILKY